MQTDDLEMDNQTQNKDLKSKKPKSKKPAQPEQLSQYKLTDFSLGSQNQPKLQGIQEGGDSQMGADHVTQILRDQREGDPEQISPKQQEKKSTAPSLSPPPDESSKQIYDPHSEEQSKENKGQQDISRIQNSTEEKNSQSLDHTDNLHDQAKMEESHDKKVKVQNRDHCNLCKDGGELICCDNCPRSFHLKCLKKKEEDIPDGDWYCDRCRPIVEKKNKQEQDKRKRAQEREKQQFERKKKQEEEKKRKEYEAERKREEKKKHKEMQEEMKIKLKQQELEQLKLKMQQNQGPPPLNLGENKIEGPGGQEKIDKSPSKQEPTSPVNGVKKEVKKPKFIQTELSKSSNNAASNQRKQEEKSELERAKEEKANQIKQLFRLFQQCFPEHIEKNQIKYPLKDELIQKMPLLHGAENIPPKPQPKNVILGQEKFENLLYVWEFCNNFQDFLNSSPFKIEELQACLSFCSRPEEVKLYDYEDAEEMSWDEKVTEEAVKSGGFGLVNSLFMAIVNKFMENFSQDEKSKQGDAGNEDDQNYLLLAIKSNIDKLEEIWPEMIRLIIKDKRKYIHQQEEIDRVLEKLVNCNPSNFNYQLTYEDKIELLQYLVDIMHDSDDFRAFLNSRIEEKSGYTKQKMEFYADIKSLEQEKQDLIKKHANSDYVTNSEQILSEITKLKEQLQSANRVESKKLNQQISELEQEKNKVIRETEKIEDQVSKRHGKIDKLNEQILQTSIKNQMLGKDVKRNEYWFFKEEPSKIFVKLIEKVPIAIPMEVEGNEEPVEMVYEEKVNWCFYDEEDEFIKLVDSMNSKGVREKKLQENLKKVGDRLKLKKSKKSQNKEEVKEEEAKKERFGEENGEEKQINTETQKENMDEENVEMKDEQQDQHHVFENDNYQDSIYQAIWFDRKKPPKKKDLRQKEFRNIIHGGGRRKENQDNPHHHKEEEQFIIEINSIKKKILAIEQFYSDISLQFSREWEKKEKREQYISQIQEATKVSEVAQTMIAMDAGFCYPHALRFKENQEDPSSMQYSGSESDEEQEENKVDDYKNVKRFKLKLFKFWNPKELRNAWRDYLSMDCQFENLNALYIAVKLLDKNTTEFAERQFDNKQKKEQKEEKKNKLQNKQDYYRLGKVNGGNRNKTDYKQFFESSSDEEGSNKKNEKMASKGRGRGRPRKKPKSDSEMEVEVVEESDEEESEEEEESEREWDHKCYVCKKGGNLMCCEGCTHVAHVVCVGLKKIPSGDWHCEQCLIKQSQRRTTRTQVQQQNKKTERQLRGK